MSCFGRCTERRGAGNEIDQTFGPGGNRGSSRRWRPAFFFSLRADGSYERLTVPVVRNRVAPSFRAIGSLPASRRTCSDGQVDLLIEEDEREEESVIQVALDTGGREMETAVSRAIQTLKVKLASRGTGPAFSSAVPSGVLRALSGLETWAGFLVG